MVSKKGKLFVLSPEFSLGEIIALVAKSGIVGVSLSITCSFNKVYKMCL